MNHKIVAIVLAAGRGKRMESTIPKQYLLLQDKPVLYYTLKAFEDSKVDEIILVVGHDQVEYCRENIIHKYNFKKISKIIEGGDERYHSVYNGLKAISNAKYVLIHDGARPFISLETIGKIIEEVCVYDACVVGVPSKDTVKIVNADGIVVGTPNREQVWSIQTPQAFSYPLIKKAYDVLMNEMDESIRITDDAMVLEHTLKHPIKLVLGEYRNIKITTPDDIIIGESFLTENGCKKV